jgi:hypothetical protein
MSRFKKAVFLSLAMMFLFGGMGCKQEGPLERAGKKVDKAVEDAGDAIKDMGEKKDD